VFKQLMGRLIFVVEDDEAVRRMVQRYLGRLGHEVLAFANAEDALRGADRLLADGGAPTLLLTDWHLGTGMNGGQLADQMRCHFPVMPTLFVTGEPHHLPPAANVLEKPFDTKLLRDAVNALLPSSLSADPNTSTS
jgi:DNA-binding response OmpR family regulator